MAATDIPAENSPLSQQYQIRFYSVLQIFIQIGTHVIHIILFLNLDILSYNQRI